MKEEIFGIVAGIVGLVILLHTIFSVDKVEMVYASGIGMFILSIMIAAFAVGIYDRRSVRRI